MSNQHRQNPDLISPPQLVETTTALQRLVTRLMQEPRVAVDTESNSLYAYHERVCLIQFTIPAGDYLVDPLALEDLSPLAPFFASTAIEKVIHAADYDLIVLQRDYHFTCGCLFDTMWAARVLGWSQVGLGHILENYFDVHPNKKFQRYDWGRRPLEPQPTSYARMDTHYLLSLREIQTAELREKGRWEEAQEIFAYLRQHVTHPTPADPDTIFWRIKGIHTLDAGEQRALYRLHLWRERTAERLDRPVVKVINNHRLLDLACVQPRNRQELRDAGMTSLQIRRFGEGVLHALRAKSRPLPPPPAESKRPPEAVMSRYHSLRAWRKDMAYCRGVDSDVILPNATLWDLSRHPPKTLDELLRVPGIGPWRQANYGPDLLALLQGLPRPVVC